MTGGAREVPFLGDRAEVTEVMVIQERHGNRFIIKNDIF